ncbi:MAG: hypothetical protein JJE08_07885 [Proteiniphilum sp.]|nr:hypothetical protein [Proteiniphilum sp.]
MKRIETLFLLAILCSLFPFSEIKADKYISPHHPDKHTFQNGYKELIMQVRKAYGNIPVFCVVGPMTNEPCFSYVKELTLYFRNVLKDNQ